MNDATNKIRRTLIALGYIVRAQILNCSVKNYIEQIESTL